MNYLIAIGTLIIALPVTIVAFAELMPEAYFNWLKRLSWGREIGGLVMFAVALALSLIAFRLAS